MAVTSFLPLEDMLCVATKRLLIGGCQGMTSQAIRSNSFERAVFIVDRWCHLPSEITIPKPGIGAFNVF